MSYTNKFKQDIEHITNYGDFNKYDFDFVFSDNKNNIIKYIENHKINLSGSDLNELKSDIIMISYLINRDYFILFYSADKMSIPIEEITQVIRNPGDVYTTEFESAEGIMTISEYATKIRKWLGTLSQELTASIDMDRSIHFFDDFENKIYEKYGEDNSQFTESESNLLKKQIQDLNEIIKSKLNEYERNTETLQKEVDQLSSMITKLIENELSTSRKQDYLKKFGLRVKGFIDDHPATSAYLAWLSSMGQLSLNNIFPGVLGTLLLDKGKTKDDISTVKQLVKESEE